MTDQEFKEYSESLAIAFGEWLRVECYDVGNGKWLYSGDDEVYPTEVLLEIFKKEINL